jgi:hypothetical protein
VNGGHDEVAVDRRLSTVSGGGTLETDLSALMLDDHEGDDSCSAVVGGGRKADDSLGRKKNRFLDRVNYWYATSLQYLSYSLMETVSSVRLHSTTLG